jgi:predicted dehydrogenase
LKISIIGYKNHAIRLRNIIKQLGYDNITTFNHHKDDINDLKSYDVYIIASPNDSHVEWIETIRSFGADKYIFCEKPPASDLDQLRKISIYDPRIYFNFNYRFSLISQLTKTYLESGELGKIVNASFISSHGLAFKSGFKNNWRFQGNSLSSSIFGNLGIHYIDLVGYLFGDISNIMVSNRNIVSEGHPDSVHISLDSKNCSSSIFITYAAPFRNEAIIIFDDGILELMNGKMTIQKPRDVFNKEKMFIPAKSSSIQTSFSDSKSYYDDSLVKSIKYFFNHVDNKKSFPSSDYERAIKTNQIVLDEVDKF